MKYKNNPANIRSGSNWLGLSGNKNGFCEFIDLSMGVRALLYLLFKYYRVYHLCSIQAIITRFAPPTENNTTAYIKFVSGYIKFVSGRNFESDYSENPDLFILLLARAICIYESNTSIPPSYLRSVCEIFSNQFPK